ncbi:MAG: methionyl-tRNA formyltransferase [Anaerolineae bacterium]|nr:methionyl-tRNA formyltransferase [Anaerolineae bacterium]
MTRVIFMGTPDFAVPTLQALLTATDYEVVGVVTQPDRPAGRGKAIQQSPVKQTALASGVPIIQPEKLRQPGTFEQLQAWNPDLIVVAAFGQILRQNVLDLPRFGCINVHASLLPRWRGAAPIQAAIRAGDRQTGITIMKMDAGLDTGPMLSQRALAIDPQDTGQTLHDKLAALGGPLLIETLPPYLRGEITPRPQDEAHQTYAPMLKKEDGLIDWLQPAVAIDRQVRAFDPWPGTYTRWDGQLLKVLAGRLASGQSYNAQPGTVVQLSDGSVVVVTGSGVYCLDRVQLPGRPVTPIGAFMNGHAGFDGSRLG